MLPTPLASNTKANHMRSGGRPPRSYWPTPIKSDGDKGPTNSRKAAKARGMWPTPHGFSKDGRSNGPSGNELGFAVNACERERESWPTPTCCMSKGSSQNSLTRKDGSSRANDRLDHAVMKSDGGSLNPRWVEWLMGWPLGWTDSSASETAKFRQWLRSHGGS